MKLAAVHTDFRLYWVPRLECLRRELLRSGDDFIVVEIAGRGSPYSFAGQSNCASSWWKCLFPTQAMENIRIPAATRQLWHTLEAEQPDVILAGAIAFPSGATAVRWACARKKRVVIMDNARGRDVPRGALVNCVKRRIYSNVDAMLLPAPSHMPDYRFWGIPDEKMFFGLNVVDNAFCQTTAELVHADAAQWRTKLQVPLRFILGIGRQVAKKNWSTLLKAWRVFKNQRPGSSLELVLVGNGPEHQLLKKLSESLRLNDVTFFDFVQPQDVMPFYSLASALVLPSLHGETWGLVVNEAMACGLPVLVSRQCGCSETLVDPGRNGWVFDGENISELASVLATLDGHSKSGLAEMGNRSRETIAGWGLGRFCSGVLSAAEYALAHPPHRPGMIDRLMLSAWKGRYRPT